jgi:Holliday junction resolvasome RuvABC endonuclease subunit
MRILGIDPGLQRTGFGCGTALARLYVGCADMSLRPRPSRLRSAGARG